MTITALGLVGTPYRYGGNTPQGGFDCSGLIAWVYRTEAGVQAPRTVAALQGWGAPVPAGRARGLALHESFGSSVAQVLEVSLDGGRPRVHRVVCAHDCGVAVHPQGIAAQVESSVAFGLSAALGGRIDLEGGAVRQRSFADYPVLTMAQMPAVETHIVPSKLEPTGMGEPALPPVAPALAGALFALNGRRLRELPLTP